MTANVSRVPDARPDIAGAAVRGVAWTGAAQVLRQFIQVASQLTLARLLVPDDFGLMGMALVFVGVAQLLTDFGIGSAIVQAPELKPRVVSTCFWINLGVGLLLAGVILAAAPLIARFYSRPDLGPLVGVLSLNLLLAALQTVPTGLLYRGMRFADLARAQVFGTLAGAVAAVSMAAAGAGAWALIAQPLVGSSVMLAVAWRASGWLPRLEYDYAEAGPVMRFSLALLGTNLVGYGNRNVDGLLIGRFLGAGPLGLYAMAVQIMLFPLQQISSVIVRVLFPALSQVSGDLPRLRSGYLKAVATIAIVTFPLMTGLFALADDMVLVVFGPAWAPMAPVLKILCWVGLIQSVGTTVGVIYLSTGNPGVGFKVALVGTPVIVVGIAAGLPWGIVGVAAGYTAATVALFYYVAFRAFRLIELPVHDFHCAIVRPLVASLAMCAMLLMAVRLVAGLEPNVRFILAIACGAVFYLAATLLINRRQLTELLSMVRSLRGKR